MAFSEFTINMGPQEGVDQLNGRFDAANGHNHDGSTYGGKKITTLGPLDGAIHQANPVTLTSSSGVLTLTEASNSFIANGTEPVTAITGWTSGVAMIRWNTARVLTHDGTGLILQGGVNRTTAAGDFGLYEMTTAGAREVGYFPAAYPADKALPGIENYIASGRKITLGTGLQANLSEGQAYIGGKTVNLPTGQISLPARSALLAYDKADGTSGTITAAYPAVDANTVYQWILNNNASIMSNPAGNNLSANGGLTKVDGWCDSAVQGDGSSGYFVSAGSTGFPTGAAARNLRVLWTCRSNTIGGVIVGYGASSVGTGFKIYCSSGVIQYTDGSGSVINTNYTVAVGQTYLIEMGYDGTNFICMINGKLIIKVAYTPSTAPGVLYVFRNISADSYDNGIVHYVELRNVAPTEAASGPIANKLCLPCRYTAYSGSYPTVASGDLAGYHEWRFSETSGVSVADSNTTSSLNGTTTGTTIVNSDIIPGTKARKFLSTSDYIAYPAMAFASDFTIIAVFNPVDFSVTHVLFGNKTATAGIGNTLAIGTAGGLFITDGTNAPGSSGKAQAGMPNFTAISSKGGQASFYLNSPLVDSTVAYTTQVQSNVAYTGKSLNDGTWSAKGTLSYLLYIPRALSQAEISKYYNALMSQATKTIVDDMAPADSVITGFIQTGSSGISLIDASSYKYGRREGAYGGNRKVFLGWKWFSGQTSLTWQNPFDTRKIKTYYSWAQDGNGTNESDVMLYAYTGSAYVGIQPQPTSQQRIAIQVQAGGVGVFNGAVQTNGYIGCYAEVIE